MTPEQIRACPWMRSIELVTTCERRGSQILMGGYSIHRNYYGEETHRTENTWNATMECGDEGLAMQMRALVP